ncbi:ribosome maturation factor RimP [Magnetococcales bacterium HHB-1]
MSRVEELVLPLAEEAASAEACGVVQVEYLHGGKTALLRISVEKKDLDGPPVGLADCAAVSDRLSGLMDVHNVVRDRYRLEVSSPGVCRPLIKTEDYHRFTGKLAVIRTLEALDVIKKEKGREKPVSERRFRGTLKGLNEDGVIQMDTPNYGCVDIPMHLVRKAHLDIDF